MQLLSAAGEEDIILSRHSPLEVRFHYLKGNGAEKEKLSRIQKGKPGSPCTEKHLASNTEFTKVPICTASAQYQKKKLAQLLTLNLTAADLQKQRQEVLDKECLCVGLSNAAAKKYDLHFLKRQEEVTICPGPNMAYFNKQVTLQQMTDHIYGRINLSANNRPHMLLKELKLYIAYFKELMLQNEQALEVKRTKLIQTFFSNLSTGIAYYETKRNQFFDGFEQSMKATFTHGLEALKSELEHLAIPHSNEVSINGSNT